MQQIIDPRQGNQRQKNLLRTMAQKAMARKGYKSKVGVFGKLAAGGGQARGMRPNRGPGAAIRGAKAHGFGSFFDGLNIGGGRSAAAPVNTAPVAAPAASAFLPSGGNPNPMAGMADLTPGYGLPEGIIPENYNPEPDPGMSIWGVPLDQGPQDRGPVESGGYNQASPSGQITGPGGLIPLGDGMWYDPTTGSVHGGAGGRNAQAM